MRLYWWIVLSSLIVLIGSGVWMISGIVRYNRMVANSSSPIGTTLTFGRSQATITISDLYTDAARSVLILRISSNDWAKLPYKGSDYHVYISSDRYPQKATSAPILLGKLSTDGDMFMVIPRPEANLYNIALMNTQFINAGALTGSTSGQSAPEAGSPGAGDVATLDSSASQQSITAALSTYHFSTDSEETGVIPLKNNLYDVVAFRITAAPSLSGAAYQPKVLPGTLLSASGEFNFKAFFNRAFKQASLTDLNRRYSALSQQSSYYQLQIDNLQSRLVQNPDDQTAVNGLSSARDALSNLKGEMSQLAQQISNYQALQYEPGMFTDLQTKAYIVHVK